MNQHVRIFLHALRTSLLFVSAFYIYKLLGTLEQTWLWGFVHTKHERVKFAAIFIVDLIILYAFVILFNMDV